MSIKDALLKRSNSTCELCSSPENLTVYSLPPSQEETVDNSIIICSTCAHQLANPEELNPTHWRCLNDSMWSQEPAVQVMAWRLLTSLRSEVWPVELLDMMYLDDDTMQWAKSASVKNDTLSESEEIVHLDSNGAVLSAGDTVVLIKDLNVKGANFTAKRGTAVRNISLVWDNAEHIEGRVEGQQIVILTKFVKKQS